MDQRGRYTLNFGAFPGASHVEATLGVNGITTADNPTAWLVPVATADHTADEHAVEPIRITAACNADDVLTFRACVENARTTGAINNNVPTAYGLWTVAWEF